MENLIILYFPPKYSILKFNSYFLIFFDKICIFQTQFFEQNEELLQTYGKLHGLKASEEYLLEHPHLCSEYTANYLTIEALNLAIDNKVSLKNWFYF